MRLPDWQKRLRSVLADARTSEFKWGENDCITLGAKEVDAITGSEYLSEIRRTYQWSTALEAARIIAEEGGIAALISKWLGEPVPFGWCGAGDLVLAEKDGREILTIHDGVQLIALGEAGIVNLPLRFAKVGWRVS